jgi:AcrR family transcriptional regulator
MLPIGFACIPLPVSHKMNYAVILSITGLHEKRRPLSIELMPKIRPETAAKRRMKILKAAHRAFNVHGINVSVDQICAEAGVSKGNFYGYFESKDELILAIAREQGEQIRSASSIARWIAAVSSVWPSPVAPWSWTLIAFASSFMLLSQLPAAHECSAAARQRCGRGAGRASAAGLPRRREDSAEIRRSL